MYKKILEGKFETPKYLSTAAADFLKRLLTTDPKSRYKLEDIRNHSWFNLSKGPKQNEGIIIGMHRIPVIQIIKIDDYILKQTSKQGFEVNKTRMSIEANALTDSTTTFIFLKKISFAIEKASSRRRVFSC